MPTTAPSASPGAEPLRRLARALALAAALLPLSAAAQDHADGAAAYAARDWAAAEALWTAEAAQGSAAAKLGLGNLYDFGLVGPPDPERAFGLYLEAADAGSAEAAFNVAVMRDSGVGTLPDQRAAAAWYAYAALGGHARAGYNLGQLFEGGDGVAPSPALAAYWYGAVAGAIPAAAGALAALGPPAAGADAPGVPALLGFRVFPLSGGAELRIAWEGGAAEAGARYRVDLVRLAQDGPLPLGGAETEGSALALPLPETGMRFALRLAQVTPEGYAAGPWITAGEEVLVPAPAGLVRFDYAADDRRAEALALRLGGALTRAGIVVDYGPADGALGESGVRYGYAQDAGFAGDVADFVPALAGAARQDAGAGLAPGEVRVALVFRDG